MPKIRKHLSYANVVEEECDIEREGQRRLVARRRFQSRTAPGRPEGEQGPKGDSGPEGAPGLSGYIQKDGFSAFDSNSPKLAEVSCPPGTTVIGGGAFINGVARESVALHVIGPENGGPSEANRWFAEAFEAIPTAASWNIDARVICAKVAP